MNYFNDKHFKNIYDSLRRLWKKISQKKQNQIGFLLLLAVLSSFTEVISIGLVLPFLGVITNPDEVFRLILVNPIITILPNIQRDNIVVITTIFFCISAIIAGMVRVCLVWFTARLSFSIGADLSGDMFRRTLYQPFYQHLNRNSSEIVNSVFNKSNAIINNSLFPTLSIISSSILLIVILLSLMCINLTIACTLFFGFGALYFVVVKISNKKLNINSLIIANDSTAIIKIVQEGIGGIRDILIDGSQEYFYNLYRNKDSSYRSAQGSNQFIVGSPRFIIEGLGMVIISLLACFITLGSVHSELAIPLLGTLAIGAVRILPLMQQIFSSWSSIVTGLPSVNDAILLLEKPTLDRSFNSSKEIIFEKKIELRSVNFQYSFADRYAIKNASLSIKKGEIVGIMGPSGGGKSTILDILMALLLPSSGDLIVDDVVISEKNARLWQRNITHVPQHIYLSDSSILENIAIGVPVENIDINRVNEAVKNAQLAETIHMLSMGLNAKVGERGVLLSGGQRQRIGIARALYKNAKILILDEATSALDNRTESEFMSSLASLRQHLTIIIVAHRLSTLSVCDRIYEVTCGEVSNSKNYHSIN